MIYQDNVRKNSVPEFPGRFVRFMTAKPRKFHKPPQCKGNFIITNFLIYHGTSSLISIVLTGEDSKNILDFLRLDFFKRKGLFPLWLKRMFLQLLEQEEEKLTYLLPAVLSSHPTLVLSPIKSLIDDTLVRCLDLNIRSCG